jgi:hypothetical protein
MMHERDDGQARGDAAPTAGDAGRSSRPVTDEDVRRRAYEFYEARGDAPGSDFDDWVAAERELRGAGRADAIGEESNESRRGAHDGPASPLRTPRARGARSGGGGSRELQT